MSTFKIYLCEKCHKVQITFDETKRAESGKLIPQDVKTKQPHDCPITSSFPCMWCHIRIYLDKTIVSKNGKRIPLDFATEEPHFCPKRPRRTGDLQFFKNRGVIG
ncbi:MAG TPA: hypothetical protein VH415_05785 [Nitrososphaeraceae archaeon]